ncbi:hypothetical protein T440DRAFT_121184 [Plenodomus tracheiphilus IPT5]|uniref:Uncharacterized protein n=1 Tax=Plenodomus tracheiphilus IPT5 TaxID=1408161 RepID=A0A6A7B425_9PLEO|nr:hypothetical protein T440DRAFT_121184 [Plenodomus tracheiphilus IPT5]
MSWQAVSSCLCVPCSGSRRTTWPPASSPSPGRATGSRAGNPTLERPRRDCTVHRAFFLLRHVDYERGYELISLPGLGAYTRALHIHRRPGTRRRASQRQKPRRKH